MSTSSDVANAERWLANAVAARDGAVAKIDKLKEHVAAAEADAEVLDAAVDAAEAAFAQATAKLGNGEPGSGVVVEAHAKAAEAEGSAG